MIPDLAIYRLAGIFVLCLLATPALSDVTGPARVIDCVQMVMGAYE